MVAFRRAKKLKDKLIKARVPAIPERREQRKITGMRPCNERLCETCPFVQVTKQFKGPFSNTVVQLNSKLTCSSKNIVYCLQCNKDNCKQIYVGHTQRALKERFGEHKTSVRKKSNNAVGDHFNGLGHSIANMNVLALEKVYTTGQSMIENGIVFFSQIRSRVQRD